jgi:hypothetical protein
MVDQLLHDDGGHQRDEHVGDAQDQHPRHRSRSAQCEVEWDGGVAEQVGQDDEQGDLLDVYQLPPLPARSSALSRDLDLAGVSGGRLQGEVQGRGRRRRARVGWAEAGAVACGVAGWRRTIVGQVG